MIEDDNPPPPPEEPTTTPPPPEEPSWAEQCPECGAYDLIWWPQMPNVGEQRYRRCRRCNASKLITRVA